MNDRKGPVCCVFLPQRRLGGTVSTALSVEPTGSGQIPPWPIAICVTLGSLLKL